MQFSTIASGSSGNCLYAANDDTHILIDAGISKKRIELGLKSFGTEGSDIDALLVTHEHLDHIQGIGVWSRKYHVPIYGTRGTLEEIWRTKSLGKLDESLFHVIRPGESFKINNIVNELQDCDLLYVEANYDLHMLQAGPYPYQLKRRIAGNYGHLCNEMSGQLIGRLLNERLQKVILGHLSKENNFPELALKAVQNELERDFSVTKETLPVSVAPRDEAMAIITL